ncbi:putative gustatory receptor 2a [Anopheles funestus]|uniref:putative gustatory receptor 2a n=1 Tax=Anopheles funestus TaxID=62324 RepID=UPI0020C6B3A6|nr:putative gustatory receptor 2a [Anopheles funestus]
MDTDAIRSNGNSLTAASPHSSRQQFLRCFRPLHILSCTFALWPFAVPVNGGSVFTRWSVLYVFAIVTGYSAFHLYINYTDAYGITASEEPDENRPTSATQQQVEANFVSIVIDIYNRYSGLVLFWLLHTVALATQRSLAAIVTGVLLVDEQIVQRLSLVPNHAQWCRFICLQAAFIFLAIGVSEYHNCIMYMSDFIPASEYCIFQCFITMLTSSAVEIQYVAFVQLIKNRLQLMNELLVELTCEHISMKIINDIKNLYTHLHLLSLHINKAYGAQLIFILMTLFVTLTTLLYYCTMKLFRMLWMGRWATVSELMLTFWAVLSTLSWAFISTFRILRICNVCNSAKNESQKIGSLIHGLGWKTNCPDTKSMVRILSLQLQQQRIEFTAGGLFTIDHGLMFNIVGSLATYLLILIQFDIAQNGAKWKAEQPAANSSTTLQKLS